MDIHPVRNDRDHARALKRVEKLWGARPGTSAAAELEVLALLIDSYEAKQHPIEPHEESSCVESGGAGSRTINCVFSDHQWSRGLARENADLGWRSTPGPGPSRTRSIHLGPSRLTTS